MVMLAAMACLAVDVSLEGDSVDAVEEGHRRAGSDLRRFARQQLMALQTGEGSAASFDVNLIGQLRETLGGIEGVTGLTGVLGPSGDTGPAGLRGVPGNQGANGPEGPTGPTSLLSGPAGVRGAEGKIGTRGLVGKQGAKGPKGVPGNKGTSGDEGPVGTRKGPSGVQGATGDLGPTGKMGAIGLTGVRGKIGNKGHDGPQATSGLVGLQGNDGAMGAKGPEGSQGPTGKQGPEGPRGDKGGIGANGGIGPAGVKGVTGQEGLSGPVGLKGADGKHGLRGPVGLEGQSGLDGDKGSFGLPGHAGRKGALGMNGYPGHAGPDGPVGAKGPTGPQGTPGVLGDGGPTGQAGVPGVKGERGSDFAYDITGPNKFSVGVGGAKGYIYSGMKGLFFEHSANPVQIRFVQKTSQQGKSSTPGIIAGYLGNIGVGTVTPEKELHIKDQCVATNEECANRKGPLLLSASWRNTVMSKIDTTSYDMIGAYTNWGGGKSAVYIGGHDQQARPATKRLNRVCFGGDVKNTDGIARFENSVGKFFATKFVNNIDANAAEQILSDADSFLDVAHTAKSVDLSHAHLALHSKMTQHKSRLSNMENEMAALLEKARARQVRRAT